MRSGRRIGGSTSGKPRSSSLRETYSAALTSGFMALGADVVFSDFPDLLALLRTDQRFFRFLPEPGTVPVLGGRGGGSGKASRSSWSFMNPRKALKQKR